MSKLFEFNKETDTWELHPHKFQAEALLSQASSIFMLKGMQAGATSFIGHWLLQEMRRCGPGQRSLSYLAIAPTLQVARNKMLPELTSIFCDSLGFGVVHNAPKLSIEITKKGERELWGHEQNEPTHIYFCYAEDSDSFAGYTSLAAIGDEIGQSKFKRNAWIELQARLTTPSGMVAPNNEAVGFPDHIKMGRFCGGTTVYQLGWLEDMYNEWTSAVAEGRSTPLHFIRFDSTANPAFPRESWELAKATMPEWKFDQRYRALFVKPAGVIYDCWNSTPGPDCNIIEPTADFSPDNLPSSYTVDVAADFGRRNFWATFWAADPCGRGFLIGYYHDSDLYNEDRGKAILEYAKSRKWNIEDAVAGQISEQYERNELARGGLIALPPTEKDFWWGINNAYASIKIGNVYAFRGACPEFEKEIKNYSMPIDENTGDVKEGEKPVNANKFHTLDTFRYRQSRKYNSLMASASIVARAGGERFSRPRSESRQSLVTPEGPAVMVYAGGGGRSISSYEKSLSHRYGIGVGRHLDIDIR